MRILFLFSILINCSNISWGQSSKDFKRGNEYLVGYDSFPPFLGGSLIDYNDSINIINSNYLIPSKYSLVYNNSCICDTNGILLFSTNGEKLLGKNHQLISNGDSLGYGFVYQSIMNGLGNGIPKGNIILPFPGSDSLFYVIYGVPDTISYGFGILMMELKFSVININLDNGIGEVILKDERIFGDTLSWGFGVTRHANGRDWWIVIPEYNLKAYYVYLFSPSGFNFVNKQYIGSTTYNTQYYSMESLDFSWKGDLFYLGAKCDTSYPAGYHWIKVFDFDRCTGILSNSREFVESTSYDDEYNCCISPNSKYLYSCVSDTIFQFDLSIQDFGSSKQIIGVYDGYYDSVTCGSQLPLFMNFHVSPVGEILIDANSTRWVHVIEHPEFPGINCSLIQRKMLLPGYYIGWPHIPNFRLGSVVGSICDSLGVGIEEEFPQKKGIEIYPTPAKDLIHIKFTLVEAEKNRIFSLTDITGREILRKVSRSNEVTLDIREFSNGTYFLNVYENNRLHYCQKVVILL